jgi:hypothetical protein
MMASFTDPLTYFELKSNDKYHLGLSLLLIMKKEGGFYSFVNHRSSL